MTFIDKRWNYLRTYILLLLLGCTVAVLAKVALFPLKQKKSLDENFIFPTKIPLGQWEAEASSKIDNKSAHHVYQYHQGTDKLRIDAVSNYRSDGSVPRMLMLNYNTRAGQIPMLQKYIPKKGYVIFFKKDHQLYLSSCLNPRGESTINDQQFLKNRYSYGWSVERTALWAMGQKDLFDGRCLWTTISSPLSPGADDKEIEKNNSKLEQAWLDWLNFWNGRW